MTRRMPPAGVTRTIHRIGLDGVQVAAHRGMLYQVPSGSKSSSSGCATGWAAGTRRGPRSPSTSVGFTRITLFGTLGTPCEHPASPAPVHRVTDEGYVGNATDESRARDWLARGQVVDERRPLSVVIDP